MKIVTVELTAEQRKQLNDLQNNGSGYLRERSLAILHCAEGRKISWISQVLNRRILTIRNWIANFRKAGVSGLERSYSPGRPSVRQVEFRPKLEEYLSASPRSYGWYEELWNMTLIKKQLQKDTGKIISTSTLERLLKDCGYSYKRPRKGVSVTAPSKEEKLARVQEIAKEILAMTKDSDVEVMFVDESHFSTEPYVIRGWYRKGEDFFPRDKSEKRIRIGFWRIQTPDKVILLEKRKQKR